ncbi:MAG: ArsA family ATPase [Acidimicrobiales bacterium]
MGRSDAELPAQRVARAAELPARPVSIEALISSREIVIACGSGGVGKTTTAASIAAMAAVRHAGKVLVVTVDPARRLASALGLEGIGNVESRVPTSAFASSGVRPRGELWAAMLDTKQSWDALVRRHAPDAATAERILENPLYQNISGKFVQSHDYIAMERLYELHAEGTFDLIVVDTPPTRNAVDFIEAPQRMAEFFSSKLLRLLIVPYRSRMVNLASRPFYQVADRILGSQFLQDIAEFFILFQTMYDGFVQRARAVERLLRDHRTTFVVVSTLEAAPLHEAEFFLRVLSAKKFHVGALVLNKVLPDYLLEPGAGERAERLCAEAAELANGGLAEELGAERAQLERVFREVGENFRNFAIVAQREAKQRGELATVPDVVASVPEFDSDIADLAGLLELGAQIWAEPARAN